jgi:hypothetical protein
MGPEEACRGRSMTPASSGSAWTHPMQLPLFGMACAVDGKTTVCAPCRWCGPTTGSIAPGAGPHFAKLLCAHGHFQGWLPRPRRR